MTREQDERIRRIEIKLDVVLNSLKLLRLIRIPVKHCSICGRYVKRHNTHGLCPECSKSNYRGYMRERMRQAKGVTPDKYRALRV